MNDLKTYARIGLQAELNRLDARRAELTALLQQLGEAGREEQPRKRRMSAEGRERIREAVQRRWAKVRAEQTSADAGPADAKEKPARSSRQPAAGRRAAGNRKK